jgi:DNA-binding transcriptional LysR family regulator
MVREFQAENPDVRVRVTATDRTVDHIGDGVDLAFHVGPLKNCSLIARRLLTFRSRLVASPCYIQNSPPLELPRDLMNHRVLTFAHWRPDVSWKLCHVNGPDQECVAVTSHLEINDFASLTAALLAGVGVGQLPPFVRPDLLSNGMLCEVMPDWHFHPAELWLAHLCNRHVSPAIRLFRAQAGQTVRRLFPDLSA